MPAGHQGRGNFLVTGAGRGLGRDRRRLDHHAILDQEAIPAHLLLMRRGCDKGGGGDARHQLDVGGPVQVGVLLGGRAGHEGCGTPVGDRAEVVGQRVRAVGHEPEGDTSLGHRCRDETVANGQDFPPGLRISDGSAIRTNAHDHEGFVWSPLRMQPEMFENVT